MKLVIFNLVIDQVTMFFSLTIKLCFHFFNHADCSYKESFSTPGDLSITEFKKRKNPNKGQLRSMVWNHFKKIKKPDQQIVAVCNYCGINYAGGDTGTSNLRHHLRRKHAELIVPGDCSYINIVSTTDDESMAEYEEVNPVVQRKIRSKVWNYYKKINKPNNKSIAVCNFCRRKFVSGAAGTHHLWNHLKRKHAKDVEPYVLTRK